MATRYAVANGNWSAPATWDGGTLPAPGDTVHASGKTVMIDQSIEVDRITTDGNSPAASGGYFQIVGSHVLTCDLKAGTSRCLEMLGGVEQVVTINGDIINGGSIGANTVTVSGVGGSPTLIVNGNVNGGGNAQNGISVQSSGVNLTVNGTVVGGSMSPAILVNSASVIEINGTIYGGTGSAADGVNANISGVVFSCNGAIYASSACVGAYLLNASEVRVSGAMYHHEGTSRAPFIASTWAVPAGEQITWVVMDDSGYPAGVPVSLRNFTSDTPPPSEVREGYVYGALNNLIGTLAVPSPEQVASGVAVDNTVGTAALKLSDIASVVGAQIAAAVGA